MTAVTFPLPPHKALPLIQNATKEGRYRLPKFPGEAWEQLVTKRQVMNCLQLGEIREDNGIDGFGNYVYTMSRFSAGVAVWVKVVLFKEEHEWIARVIEVWHDE